jgi:hypothetical protein
LRIARAHAAAEAADDFEREVALSGERIYASDGLLELRFGPTLALATPVS